MTVKNANVLLKSLGGMFEDRNIIAFIGGGGGGGVFALRESKSQRPC